MNKNLIVVLYFSLAGLCVLILGLVTIFQPQQIESTVGWVIQLLGLASTAAVTIYLLGKNQQSIEEVKQQTNGTLSALREENARLNLQLLQVVSNSPTITKQ